MIYEFENASENIKFSIPAIDNRAEMYRQFKAKAEAIGAPMMSAPSFARLMGDESVSAVKGWRVALSNPVAANIAKTERDVHKRDEKRQQQKAHKRAEKAAKRNIAQGSRKRVNAQKRAAEKKASGGRSFHPSKLCMALATAMYQK